MTGGWENASVRELARRYAVHRRVVRQALDGALPPQRKTPVTRRSALDPAKGWIDEMLWSDLTAPPKQRHTNKRILDRLRDEYGFTAVAYTTLNDYLRGRQPQIREEADRARMMHEGMVPQFHRPGEEGEVDYAEVWVRVDGKPMQRQLRRVLGPSAPISPAGAGPVRGVCAHSTPCTAMPRTSTATDSARKTSAPPIRRSPTRRSAPTAPRKYSTSPTPVAVPISLPNCFGLSSEYGAIHDGSDAVITAPT